MGCQKNKYGQVLNLQGYKQISTNEEARWTLHRDLLCWKQYQSVTPRYSPKTIFQVLNWQSALQYLVGKCLIMFSWQVPYNV